MTVKIDYKINGGGGWYYYYPDSEGYNTYVEFFTTSIAARIHAKESFPDCVVVFI